jgi:short subunit dehydrogenase-like uncharacterized protein
MAAAGPRELDVVVYGATGFVGRLTAEYLARHAPGGVTIALAGRSLDRLEQVRSDLGAPAAAWPLIGVDAGDLDGLRAMAARTKVVATTVGPYRTYGLPLVEACAEAGTHYADLTGEVLFMRDAIDRFHAVAERSGARIVHSCGFDSIPSDLGVLLLHQAAEADGAGDLEDTALVVRRMKGGASGGTIASAMQMLEDFRADPALRRIAEDPYALSPDREAEPDLGDQPELSRPVYDADLGTWLAPFVMAAVNTRVVRRSNALQQWAYGRRFRYREVTAAGDGAANRAKATLMAAGMAAGTAAMERAPVRKLFGRFLPKPGEGPSEKTRRNGFFEIEIHTRTATGRRYVCRAAAQGDPGYAATSVMLGESALCLAADADRLPDGAGVLTPATAMGDALVARLRAAGHRYEVEERSP